jgi:hypothetical protein
LRCGDDDYDRDEGDDAVIGSNFIITITIIIITISIIIIIIITIVIEPFASNNYKFPVAQYLD